MGILAVLKSRILALEELVLDDDGKLKISTAIVTDSELPVTSLLGEAAELIEDGLDSL